MQPLYRHQASSFLFVAIQGSEPGSPIWVFSCQIKLTFGRRTKRLTPRFRLRWAAREDEARLLRRDGNEGELAEEDVEGLGPHLDVLVEDVGPDRRRVDGDVEGQPAPRLPRRDPLVEDDAAGEARGPEGAEAVTALG